MLNRSIVTELSVIPAFTILLSTLALTAGCGQKEENAKPVTQVAAIVNGDEITVHQINNVLEQAQNVTVEGAEAAKREILDKLINQQLAKQKAIENNLDRSPKVMQAIESAKTEILARAYLQELAAALPEPQKWETEKYYSDHPELFAQRRLFDIEEFVFVADDAIATNLRVQLSEGRSMPEFANWLRSQGINFVANNGTRTAEQTSFDVLPKVQAMKAGQIQLIETGDGRYRLIRLVNFETDPLDEAIVTPRIQQFLLNQRASEIIVKEMKNIKANSTIEYLGEFASHPNAGEAKGEVTEDTLDAKE